jgi:hypothetical protein
MQLTGPIQLERLPYISPSIYAAARICGARGAWASLRNRPRLPEHPSLLLGLCFHSVVERAAGGELTTNSEEVLLTARESFDATCRELYAAAHPLLRAKFEEPDRLPGYYLYRERAAVAAVNVFKPRPSVSPPLRPIANRTYPTSMAAETRLKSADGLLVGRPDVVDAHRGEVLDYKTGIRGDNENISESELRQLRLYAHLASENGILIRTGVIVRANGRRISVGLFSKEIHAEVESARQLLSSLNRSIQSGATFRDLAMPSASGCRMCPCMAFCERFWESAEPTWLDECGIQLQGAITNVAHSTLQGMQLVSLTVEVGKGTSSKGLYTIEQIPEAWLLVERSAVPAVNENIRALDVRRSAADSTIVRADRATTMIWSISTPVHAGGLDG